MLLACDQATAATGSIITSRPEQNGHGFADDTIRRIRWEYEKILYISNQIWLKFVLECPIDNKILYFSLFSDYSLSLHCRSQILQETH